MAAAKDARTAVGEQLGAAKDGLKGVQASTEPLKTTLDDLASKYNISVEDGTWGDIQGSNAAQKMYQQVQGAVSKPTVDARELESLTSQIDKQLGVYTNKGISAGNPSVRVLSDLKSALNETIAEASPEFGALNSQYAQLTSNIKQIEAASSDKIGKEAVFNPETLLRRSTGNAGAKSKAAFEAMEEISKITGAPAPTDLPLKANLAAFAEDMTKSSNTTALQATMSQSLKDVTTSSGEDVINSMPFGKTLNAITKAIKGKNPVIAKNAGTLINWLAKGAADSGGGIATDMTQAEVNKAALALETLVKAHFLSQPAEKKSLKK